MNRTPIAPSVAARVARLLEPLDRFLHVEAASGIVLLIAAALALLWANSPWPASYEHFWHAEFPGLGSGHQVTVHFLVNEGLMTFFFMVVGLEIRREIHDGALSTLRQAALPIAAAIGGILAPAGVYLLLNTEPSLRHGWAIPTATDIAFAVGVLALLGKRVDPALRVLLLALAITDDIVAVLVIAFFYAQGIGMIGVGFAVAGVVGVWVLQKLGVRTPLVYVVPGAVVWLGLLDAGVPPVLAGVILGLLVPVAAPASERPQDDEAGGAHHSPAVQLENSLHPWVAYGAMPLFALANAGVRIDGLDLTNGTSATLGAGIVLALVVGKPLGIIGVSALCIATRLCALPPGVTWAGVLVIGCLGGIGFTMSIFIATLAFPVPELLAVAKLAVLAASVVAAIAGLAAGRWLLPRPV